MASTTLGQAIKMTRTRLGFTQVEIAEALDIPQSHLSRWELDKAVPSLEQVGALEVALGVRRGALLVQAGYVDSGITDIEIALRTYDGLSEELRGVAVEMFRLVIAGSNVREGQRAP